MGGVFSAACCTTLKFSHHGLPFKSLSYYDVTQSAIATSLPVQVRDLHIVVEATLLAVKLGRKRKPFLSLGFEFPVIWIALLLLVDTVVQNPQDFLVRAFRTKEVKVIRLALR